MELKNIDSFQSVKEFNDFEKLMSDWIQSGYLTVIQKQTSPYTAIYGDVEQYYQDRSGVVWLLIEPDYPFKGLFLPLTSVI